MINLHDGQITDLLSNSMKYNPETIAVGYAVLQEKRRLLDLADRTRLMSAIVSLDEKTLDYLAVELRTPAYDDSFPLSLKRELIAGTLPFYAKLGTPLAVNWIIQAIFGVGQMEEWYQYGGEPHHFRVVVYNNTDPVPLERQERLLRAVFAVKRLSSWLDSIIITTESTGFVHLGACSTAKAVIEIWPELVSQVEVTGGTGVETVHASKQRMEVFPELVRQVDLARQAASSALTAQRQRVEVWPELPTRVETLTQASTDGLLTQHQILEIYPDCAEGESK